MAAKGEGGYVMQVWSWNGYNKQIGNAMDFKNLSRRELERIQLFGCAKVFLFHSRFLEFAKFAWPYCLLAWESFLKIMGFQKQGNAAGCAGTAIYERS
jgi:hypothetical protein